MSTFDSNSHIGEAPSEIAVGRYVPPIWTPAAMTPSAGVGTTAGTLPLRFRAAPTTAAPSAPTEPFRRAFELRDVEWRDGDGDDGSLSFEGHAAVFDELSENLGGFREKIKRGAFKEVLDDDVRFLVNHDENLLLARTTSGTLKLKEDPTGLKVRADLAPTSYADDLRILLDRGDMSQMSFAFGPNVEDEWEEDDEGRLMRTIKRFKRLYDVSAVTYPAYPQTDAGMRGLDKLRRGASLSAAERAAVSRLLENSTQPSSDDRPLGASAEEPEPEGADVDQRGEVESERDGAGLTLSEAVRRLELRERELELA